MINWLLNWIRSYRQQVMQDAAERLLTWQQTAMREEDCIETQISVSRQPSVLVYI